VTTEDPDGALVQLADARREDGPFLGWVLQAASRSHLERGVLDVFVGGSEEECRRFLGALPLTAARHMASFENFIVATVRGAPAGALCGYFEEAVEPMLGKAAIEVAVQLGWSHDDLVAAWQRILPNRYVRVERVSGAWIVESVAVVPALRRTGIVRKMLDHVLERGRQHGARCAEVSVLIGNEAAQRAYEQAGFAVVQEVRNAEYEAAFQCPGVRLLRRAL
jgi:ribosomal protein S18 acetylase RimI-like enzyme